MTSCCRYISLVVSWFRRTMWITCPRCGRTRESFAKSFAGLPSLDELWICSFQFDCVIASCRAVGVRAVRFTAVTLGKQWQCVSLTLARGFAKFSDGSASTAASRDDSWSTTGQLEFQRRLFIDRIAIPSIIRCVTTPFRFRWFLSGIKTVRVHSVNDTRPVMIT